jgi:tRNA C32,U32 (ribose-2'-O)-methylase TrmJ
MDPEAFAAEASRRQGRIALVFGDERTGLGRNDLARCHALTRIPADAGQPSLNVAQAICVYAYALARTPERRIREISQPGTDADLRRLEHVLDDVLRTSGFVRRGSAGVAPLLAPWRRSGLTRMELRLWESAIRTLARSLKKSRDSDSLT